MAKVIITIEDSPAGDTDITINFDPTLVMAEPPTPAQSLGLELAKAMGGEADEFSIDGE